ncbi:nucleotide exchange factor GrpE [Patescibacteria group bacterium]
MSEQKKELKIEDIKKKLEELGKQKSEYLSGWQRERADFLNYKKEEMERIGELINYAKEELILKFLPVMDNFEIVGNNFSENLKKDEHIKGLLQIKNQLQNFLKNLGVEEIKSIGEKFDPKLHEVIGEIESKDKKQDTIVEEIQKGYTINGRLLRPAKVKVVK